jgi:hypothetical protein
MTTDELERALRLFGRRRPFRSFLIEFVSGDRLLATHPEAVGRFGNLFYYYGPDRAERLFVASSVCQLLDPPAEASEPPDIS